MTKRAYGFTIVELLIVIVVIAILAAISIVSYTGIQQRANNAAIISAVSQTRRSISAYISNEGRYPLTAGVSTTACITTASGCFGSAGTYAGNGTLDSNVESIAALPRSAPKNGANRYGIMYNYEPGRTFNGQSQPVVLSYYLNGTNQNCGVPSVMNAWTVMGVATSGYTEGNTGGSGKTWCLVGIPGPGA